MQIAVRGLAQRRNALTRIQRALPSELLTHIFACCAASEPCLSDGEVRLGWIKVSHVCHQWRQTALECPRLWASIPLPMGEAWVEEMMARSQRARLSFYDFGYGGLTLTARQVDLLGSVIGRSSSIDLHLNDVTRLAAQLTAAAPHLKTLCLYEISDFGYTLPVNFLADEAPRLRHLYLHGITHTGLWTSGILQNLVSLNIKGSQYAYLPSFHTVLGALHSMRALKSLALDNSFPPHSPLLATAAVVELKMVKECRFVNGPWLDILQLLAHVNLPSTVKLTLELSMGESTTEDPDYRPLLPVLATYYHATAQDPLPILEFAREEDDLNGNLSLLAWRCQDRGFFNIHANTRIEFSWAGPALMPQHPGRMSLLLFLAAHVPMAYVRRLFIMVEPESSGNVPFSVGVWTALLRRSMNRLHEIRAFGQSGLTLAQALEDVDVPQEIEVSSPPFLYRLAELDLRFVQFRTEKGVGVASVLNVFCDWLAWRSECGYPIVDLKLTNCRLSARDVAAWRAASPYMILEERYSDDEGSDGEDYTDDEDSEE
ncbi:hypothetical protein FA95DRAFT_1562626 [Auriscalpium vulgare]|uniref:Uncharacterized protein n=1 Tax=Auriscalpium vulgare TaxID=40419 RepID=A0ACB8RJ54_9AGAM|nr:hypothetical protein FA95DRAFT_1562626 [Auriscalpium vulgare]